MPDTLDSSTLSNGGGVGGGGVYVCVCVCERVCARGGAGVADRAEENAALKAQQKKPA